MVDDDKKKQIILDRLSVLKAKGTPPTSLALKDRRVLCLKWLRPFTKWSKFWLDGELLVFGEGSPELIPESRLVLAGDKESRKKEKVNLYSAVWIYKVLTESITYWLNL